MKVSLVSEYIATLSNLISILRIMCLYLERLFVPIIWRLFVYLCTQTNSSLLLKVMWFPPSFTEFASACVQEGPSTIVYKELPRITGAISFYLSSEDTEHRAQSTEHRAFLPFWSQSRTFWTKIQDFIKICRYCNESPSGSLHYPHNSNPRPANAAALLRQQLAATSAAGAFDVDSSGSDATAE